MSVPLRHTRLKTLTPGAHCAATLLPVVTLPLTQPPEDSDVASKDLSVRAGSTAGLSVHARPRA